MATSDISNPAHRSEKPLPKLSLFTMFRLGLFQMGLGVMSLLTLGVLNRIMIDELKVLPFLAAAAIAMHQFVSPARVWFGQMSDARPLFGYHRSGYIWIGAAVFTSLAFVALQVVWQLGISIQATGWSPVTYAWTGAVALVFALYGLALSASSTPFAALLVDVSDEENRSKLVGIVWSLLMVGIVVGAIVSGRLLDRPEICGAEILTYNPTRGAPVANIAQLQATINPVFTLMPAIVLGLCLVSTFGIEKTYSRFATRSTAPSREDQITLKSALSVLTASRQTGLFFSFLLMMTLSLFMQDAVMEPFGGEVFGMCIAETTKLNAFWGTGTLIGIASTGFFLIPRLGKQKATKFGCIFAAICMLVLIIAGFSANPTLLRSGLLFFGLASGMLTAGATSLMLDLTAAETAGTFIGAWGLSQAIARGLATVLGGTVLNIGKILFPIPAMSYGLVFLVQAVGMLVAVWLLSRVDVREFKENARAAIATVMRGEID